MTKDSKCFYLLKSQKNEIEELTAVNRDLMLHLQAAEQINDQESYFILGIFMNYRR